MVNSNAVVVSIFFCLSSRNITPNILALTLNSERNLSTSYLVAISFNFGAKLWNKRTRCNEMQQFNALKNHKSNEIVEPKHTNN